LDVDRAWFWEPKSFVFSLLARTRGTVPVLVVLVQIFLPLVKPLHSLPFLPRVRSSTCQTSLDLSQEPCLSELEVLMRVRLLSRESFPQRRFCPSNIQLVLLFPPALRILLSLCELCPLTGAGCAESCVYLLGHLRDGPRASSAVYASELERTFFAV
jgi:hypothetical protein